MPLVAPFKDGQFVTNTASTNSINNAKENKSGMDSDAFLQLLVAEMQNQDPLEPTSNTEWVSQYATFTQVSEIQNIGNDMQSMKAQDLVGEYVIMKVTDAANGESDYVSGQVDYIEYEEGKAFLSINGNRYSIDDLDTVASKEYMEAYNLSAEIVDTLNHLPSIQALTTSDKKVVNDMLDKVDNMTPYQKNFLSEEVNDLIASYRNRMSLLTAAENALKNETAQKEADAEKAKAEAEAEKAKAEAEKAEADKAAAEAEKVTAEAEKAKAEAEKAKAEAEKAKAEAESKDTSKDEEPVSEEIVDALTKDTTVSDDEIAKNSAENGLTATEEE